MLISIMCDFGSDDTAMHIKNLLSQYGLKEIQANLFESTSFRERDLPNLKFDLDRATDSYDKLRIYQYPVEHMLVISSLNKKKWTKSRVTYNQEA